MDISFRSVHLENFPQVANWPDAEDLARDMDRVRSACNAALAIRNQENIRVRQPLRKLTIVAQDAKALAAYEDIIKDELNVKEVVLETDVLAHADYQLKIHFPILGKRLPAKMKEIIAACKQGKWQETEQAVEVAGEALEKEEYDLQLQPKQNRGAGALSSNDALVILDLEITAELEQEGIARDLVRLIQQSRKEAELEITDRIRLTLQSSQLIEAAAKSCEAFIAEQTLAAEIVFADPKEAGFNTSQSLEGDEVKIGIDVHG